MTKMTHAQFIERLSAVNPGIEAVGVYQGSLSQISVRCRKCGHRWVTTAGNLTRSVNPSGCPECSKKSTADKRRLSESDFVSKLAEVNPTVKYVSGYADTRSTVALRCKVCGNEWTTKASSVIKRNPTGCRKCSDKKRGRARAMSHEEFTSKLAQVNPTIEVVGTYQNAGTRIKVRCQKCGTEWEAWPGHLLNRRSGCVECFNAARRISPDDFVEEMARRNPDIEIIGRYSGMTNTVKARCALCGHVWNPSANNIYNNGAGCPKCSGKMKLNQDEIVRRVREANSDVEIIGETNGFNNPVRTRCLRCGNEWDAVPYDLAKGLRCRLCSKGQTSFMEQYLLIYLRELLGEDAVVSRDREAIGEEIDILIPEYKLALEPGSWHWHRDKHDADLRKRVLCAEAGIRLITIYDAFDGNEPPFSEDCYVFPYDLGSEEGNATLLEMSQEIVRILGITSSLPNEEVIRVRSAAKEASLRMTHDEFVERLAQVNGSLVVVGRFEGLGNKVTVECSECGRRWSTEAGRLLRGAGCAKCSGYAKKTTEEFVEDLARVNPKIKVVGEYSVARKPIDVECSVCGYAWSPTPNSLLNGVGCPKCGKRKAARKITKTQSQVLADFSEKRPDLEPIGEYLGTMQKMAVRGKECGHVWETRPNNLFSARTGCPVCLGRKPDLADKYREEICAWDKERSAT